MDQKDDFDLRDFLPYLLNQAAEESSYVFQQVYKDRYGMLRNEWRVLFHVGRYGQMTAKDIGVRAKLHKTKISRAVSKLEKRRYLVRTRDETDRRSEILSLTAAGQTVYKDLRETAQRYDAELSAMFPTGEAALLRTMLRRLSGVE